MPEDLVRNRKALHDYTVLETWEAGIALLGTEVKALRNGRGQLQDAYVDASSGELWLKQAHISPYEFGTCANHEPLRPRKLLLKRAEIQKILSKVERKGYTL
ncbi:MAG TPA: SsrA-binding protein, partial [Holophaga sp.]|nr:SsrA-binding protein [Holophaga sp.]